jgi:hypothetical protein
MDFEALTAHEGFPVIVMGLLMMAFSIWGLLAPPSRNPFRLLGLYRMGDAFHGKGVVHCSIILSGVFIWTGIAIVLGFAPYSKSIFEEPQPDSEGASAPHQSLAEVTFQIDHPDSAQDEPSPYVSLAAPAEDIRQMRNSDEVVFAGTELILILDYPFAKEWEFPIRSESPAGFTRAELARKISETYKTVYDEEELTSTTKVVPMEERKGLINRNTTTGKYGIWGHDLGDLVLHTIELSKRADGKVQARLWIDS